MLSEPEPLWRRAKVRRHQIYAKRLRLAPLLTIRSREGPAVRCCRDPELCLIEEIRVGHSRNDWNIEHS